ncbi:MAG: hypothetical protein HYT89_04795 [Candidatus Omnitrophica bacterium]|nr:hypothetical protein [Candidatus Omnitrophota bacterium]
MKTTGEAGPLQEKFIVFLIIAAGVLLRVIPHPWNVSPILGLALFSGAHLKTRTGALLLLATLFASDLFLGFDSTLPFVWGSFLLVLILGKSLKSAGFGASIFLTTLSGSSLFYLISNLGVFLATPLYEKTWTGLLRCYVLAIPFFRNAVIGDQVYALVFFGTYHLAFRKSVLKTA